MSFEETLNIDTPENVTFDYEVAGIGSRFAAALIDTLIILVLQVITNLLIIVIALRFGDGQSGTNAGSLGGWVVALVGLISFLFLWGYYIFFEMIWNGQTPGKKAVHLRVIRADGTPITLTESIVRNLVRLADFLPLFYGVGTIAVFVNRQTRRLGDLAAGTLVVREKNQQITLKDLAALHAAANAQPVRADLEAEGQPPLTYPVDRLTYQDIQMVESFFQRQNELVNQEALAQQILNSLLTKMGAQTGYLPNEPARSTLATILSEYRRLHQQS